MKKNELKIKHLKQNTSEWLAWRTTKCCASDAPIIMGVAPAYWDVRTWQELTLRNIDLGKNPNEFTKNAWEHGHKMEAKAVDLLRKENPFFDEFESACVERGNYAASLDLANISRFSNSAGYDAYDLPAWVEIKSPVSETSKLLKIDAQNLPEYVLWQLVHQAYLIYGEVDANYLCNDFMQLSIFFDGAIKNVQIEIPELLDKWPDLRSRWEDFSAGKSQWKVENEAECFSAGERWLAANFQFQEAKKELAKEKSRLIEIIGEKVDHYEDENLIYTRVTRRGSVDFAKIAKENWSGSKQDFDKLLAKNKKPATEFISVRAKNY